MSIIFQILYKNHKAKKLIGTNKIFIIKDCILIVYYKILLEINKLLRCLDL